MIALSWTDATDETGYRIERSLNGTSGWSQVGTATANTTSFLDTNLPENVLYYYRVTATNAAGESAPAASATAQSPLATPASVTATVVSSSRIDLAWTDRSSGETSYLIEQSSDGATGWTQVGTTAANRHQFLPRRGRLTDPRLYYFRIRGTRPGARQDYLINYSNFSTVASATHRRSRTPPGVQAMPTAEGTITVSWDDATNETGYRIERSLNGTSSWTRSVPQLSTPPATATPASARTRGITTG